MLPMLCAQELAVDNWAKIESQRLGYLAKEQSKLRADKYRAVREAVEAGLRGEDIGKPKVLPSSFIGGDRNMRQLFQVMPASTPTGFCWQTYSHVVVADVCHVLQYTSLTHGMNDRTPARVLICLKHHLIVYSSAA